MISVPIQIDRKSAIPVRAQIAAAYAAAIRGCLLSHPTLGGVASRLDWAGEQQGDVDVDQARTLAAVAVRFRVQLTDVAGTGPVVMPIPEPDPHQPWPADPTVQTTTITTIGEAP